ncbi:MAG: hypothetical protein WBB28_04435 [Crinalium sp.]
MKLKRLTEKTQLLPETKEILALCFVGIAGVQALILLFILFISVKINATANRKPTNVQLLNGQTYYVSEKDQYWRYPTVIQKFVRDWSQLTFNWDSKVPGTDEVDQGVKVGNKKVPSSTYFASLLMEPKFGKASLTQIADLVPTSIFSGGLRAAIIISYISEPREVKPGVWDVDMIATRLLVDRKTGSDERLEFNRTFRIKATDIQNPTFGKDTNVFEQKVYELRASGLEIQQLSEFIPLK